MRHTRLVDKLRHTRLVDKRWPGWVYGEGDEPDPRFSFANERTFLAWVRTALALLAGGVALHVLPLTISWGARTGLAALFIVLAVMAAVAGWLRWAQAERAMRVGAPLPGLAIAAVLTLATVVAGLALLVVLTLE